MDHNSRVQAALRGQAVDRVPYSLWRHYHGQDRTPQGLADATLELVRTYDLDLVKLTPSGLYGVEDWVQDRAEGRTPAHIVYPGTEHEAPYLAAPALVRPEEWRSLRSLPPQAGALGRELEAIGLVAGELAGSRPLLMTIFSPLTLAYKLAGERIVEHLRQQPAAVHAGLEVMADTTAHFARAALQAGADGVFFATQLARRRWLTAAEYGEFGARYDVEVLNALAPHSSLTVLHLHGRDVFFELVNEYPIQAVSWHDRETAPDLASARGLTDRAFLSGLDRDLLGGGPAAAIAAQARQAMAQTKGRGLILAPSCVIPTTAPAAHLQAVRDAVLATV